MFRPLESPAADSFAHYEAVIACFDVRRCEECAGDVSVAKVGTRIVPLYAVFDLN